MLSQTRLCHRGIRRTVYINRMIMAHKQRPGRARPGYLHPLPHNPSQVFGLHTPQQQLGREAARAQHLPYELGTQSRTTLKRVLGLHAPQQQLGREAARAQHLAGKLRAQRGRLGEHQARDEAQRRGRLVGRQARQRAHRHRRRVLRQQRLRGAHE